MTIIKCNNCEAVYDEDKINILECCECKTDEYLIEDDSNQNLEQALDFKPMPQEIMDQCNNEWETE